MANILHNVKSHLWQTFIDILFFPVRLYIRFLFSVSWMLMTGSCFFCSWCSWFVHVFIRISTAIFIATHLNRCYELAIFTLHTQHFIFIFIHLIGGVCVWTTYIIISNAEFWWVEFLLIEKCLRYCLKYRILVGRIFFDRNMYIIVSNTEIWWVKLFLIEKCLCCCKLMA